MATIVPLISSGVTGPLGVRHLPRLWLKVSLETRGKLAAGYPGIGKGYDMMTLNALGLNPDAVKKFISEKRPTYPQFESWIRKQPGVKLDKATIYKLNTAIMGYIHDDATRKGIDRSREAAQQLGDRAGEYYEATRGRAAELYSQAAEKVTEVAQTAREAAARQSGTLSAAVDAGKKAYQDEKRKTEMSGRIEAAPNYGNESSN